MHNGAMVKKICLGVMLIGAPVAASADDIEWLLAPYGWLPAITLEQSGGTGDPGDGGNGGLGGKSLLDVTESFFKFRAEAARNRWGVMLDYITLSLADQTTLTARPPFNITIDVDARLDLEVVELGAFYRPSGEVAGINYLAGFRYIGADTTLFLTPSVGPEQRQDSKAYITDVYLGARYVHQFGSRWTAKIRGDYSFGESEGTLNLLGSVDFRVAGPFALQAGYRHAVIEFEESSAGERVTTEIELSGPFIGFVFRF